MPLSPTITAAAITAAAILGLTAQARAADEVESGSYCSVLVSGHQNIWTYMGHLKARCAAGDMLWVSDPERGTEEAASLATLVCRFDRAIVVQPSLIACIYRGGPREQRRAR